MADSGSGSPGSYGESTIVGTSGGARVLVPRHPLPQYSSSGSSPDLSPDLSPVLSPSPNLSPSMEPGRSPTGENPSEAEDTSLAEEDASSISGESPLVEIFGDYSLNNKGAMVVSESEAPEHRTSQRDNRQDSDFATAEGMSNQGDGDNADDNADANADDDADISTEEENNHSLVAVKADDDDGESESSSDDEGDRGKLITRFPPPADLQQVQELEGEEAVVARREDLYIAKFPVGHIARRARTDKLCYIPPDRMAEKHWLMHQTSITDPPSDGMLEEIREGGEMDNYLQLAGRAAIDTYERVLWHYDKAMETKLQAVDALMLAHKQIRHDRVEQRAYDELFTLIAKSESVQEIHKVLAETLLANSKLRDQNDMLREGLDPSTAEFLEPLQTASTSLVPGVSRQIEGAEASKGVIKAEKADPLVVLQRQHEGLQQRYKELQAANRPAELTIKIQNNAITELNDRIIQYQKECWSLETEKKALREELELRDELDMLREGGGNEADNGNNNGNNNETATDFGLTDATLKTVRNKLWGLEQRAIQAETKQAKLEKENKTLQKTLADEQTYIEHIEEVGRQYEERIRKYARLIKELRAKTEIPFAKQYSHFLKSVQDAVDVAKRPQKAAGEQTELERAISSLKRNYSQLEKHLPPMKTVGCILYKRQKLELHIIKREARGLLARMAKMDALSRWPVAKAPEYLERSRRIQHENIALKNQIADLKQKVNDCERKMRDFATTQKTASPLKNRVRELEKADAEQRKALEKYQEITSRIPPDAVIAFTDEQLQQLVEYLPTVTAYYDADGELEAAIDRAKDILPSNNPVFNVMLENLVKAFSEQAWRQDMANADMLRTRERIDHVTTQENKISQEKGHLLAEHFELDKERAKAKAAANARQAEIDKADRELRQQQEEAARRMEETTKEIADQLAAAVKLKDELKMAIREKKDSVVADIEARQRRAEEEMNKMQAKLAQQRADNEKAAKQIAANKEKFVQEKEAEQVEIARWVQKQKELDQKKDDLLTREKELAQELSELQKARLKYRTAITRLRVNKANMVASFAAQMAEERRATDRATAEELKHLRARLERESRPSAACFCSLLKFFLPDVYRAIIGPEPIPRRVRTALGSQPKSQAPRARDPIQTEQDANPPPDDDDDEDDQPQPDPTTTHGHGHGHASLADPWPYICQVLTSAIWLIFLLLLYTRNMTNLCLFSATIIFGVPLHLLRLLGFYLVKAYRRTLSSLPRPLRNILTPVTTSRPRPEFWLAQPPAAADLVGLLIAMGLGLTILAAQAVSVERRIWLGMNGWRSAYVRDIADEAPYPGWWPVEVDFRLAFEPLLGPLLELAHAVLFEMSKGSEWRAAWGGWAVEWLREWQ